MSLGDERATDPCAYPPIFILENAITEQRRRDRTTASEGASKPGKFGFDSRSTAGGCNGSGVTNGTGSGMAEPRTGLALIQGSRGELLLKR